MFRVRIVILLLTIAFTTSFTGATNFIPWPDATKSAFQGAYIGGRYAEAPPLSKSMAIADDGTVAMIDAAGHNLLLYPHLTPDGSFAAAKSIPLETTPLQVVYKRLPKGGVFVVALGGSGRPLNVIDAHTGAAMKSCPMMASEPFSLAPAANADCPFVYYSGDMTGVGRPMVGRVDLSRSADDGPITLPDYDLYEITSSDDGMLLYARRPGSSPVGFMSFRITTEEVNDTHPLRATKLIYEHETRPPYRVDPSTGNVASGKVLYAPDLSSTVATLPVGVVAFSRTKPLMFGFAADDNLQVMSTNTRAVLATVPLTTPVPAVDPKAIEDWKLPPNLQRRNRPSRKRAPGDDAPFVCLVDDAHQSLLLASPEHVAVIHLADLLLPNEPTLGVTIAGVTTLVQGQSWAAAVKPKEAKTIVTLGGSPPAGLSCTHNTLHWTPAVADIGSHAVLLHLASGDATRDVPLMLDVRRPSMIVGFDVRSLNVSPDGALALLVGTDEPSSGRSRRRSNGSNLPHLVLIDLRNQKVLARRTMEIPISAAAVDSQYAYVGLQGSAAMVALSLRDLSDAKRVFTAGPVYQFLPTGPRVYVGMQGKPTTWFATPQLTPDPVAPAPGPFDNESTPLPTRAHGGWFIDDVLYAGDFKSVKWLVQDDQLPRLTPAALPLRSSTYGPPPVDDWGVHIVGEQLRRTGGQEVIDFAQRGQISNGEACVGAVLHDVPALAVLKRSRSRSDTAALATERADLGIFDVVTGDQRATLPLDDEPTNPGDDSAPPLLDSVPGKIIAAVNGRLFMIPADQMPLEKLTRPLEVLPPDGALTIATTGPTTLTYSVTGGQVPVTLTLGVQVEGITLDGTTHHLTIDPTPLLPKAIDQIVQTIASRFSYVANGVGTAQTAPGSLYKDWAAKRYRQYTGRSPMGYVAAVPISVVVTDAEQQQFMLLHTLLIDVPAERVDARLAAAAERVRPAVVASPASRPSSTAALQQRIDQLTLQNQRLQAKVEVLTDLLTREHGGATTQP